jgi:hypothetical protein
MKENQFNFNVANINQQILLELEKRCLEKVSPIQSNDKTLDVLSFNKAQRAWKIKRGKEQ